MSLYRRSSAGPWWYRFTVGAREYRASTGTGDRRLAQEAERRARAEVETATAGNRGGGAVDLAQLAEWDAARTAAKGSSAAWVVEIARAWATLGRILDARTIVDRLRYQDLERYVATRRAEGARGQTIRRELQAIPRGVKLARKRRRAVGPIPDLPEVSDDAPCEGRTGKLIPFDVLIAWIDELSPEACDEAFVVFLTGLRDGEVKRLTWRWVEQAPPKLVAQGIPWVVRATPAGTKKKRERILGLPQEAYETLERRAKLLGEDGPLFSACHRTAYENAAARIGWPKPITLRDLRHTHATVTTEETGDVLITQAALGHRDLKTTQRYVTARAGRGALAAGAVSRALISAQHPRHSEEAADEDPHGEGTPGRDRTGDLQFRKLSDPLLVHILACQACLSRAVESMRAQGCAHEGRHTDSAQRTNSGAA